jgi:hypothetical protein
MHSCQPTRKKVAAFSKRRQDFSQIKPEQIWTIGAPSPHWKVE